LENNCAAYFAAGLRFHRGIENKLHYTGDVSMREDRECTKEKQAAANLVLLRDFAFNITKSKNKSIKYAAEVFANHNVNKLYSILIRT
jgi:predicted transposase YbfD/YdcC